MRTTRTRRLVALISGAALLASLAATTVAGPVGAAEPVTCKGKVATIVGTQGDDVLVGTPGRDIIAGLGGDDVIRGLGGHDLICAGQGADRVKGNQGRDRLYGNAGPDKLFGGKGPDTLEGGVSDDWLKGQKGDDALDGGPGTDTCYQDLGSGSETSCELPVKPVVAPKPEPKPDPIDLTDVLAIAYTDLNKNQVPDAGDVMIAQLVDTDANGPDAGDIIEMGMYPTTFGPVWPTDFGDWKVESHVATLASVSISGALTVTSAAGRHVFLPGSVRGFQDNDSTFSNRSYVEDSTVAGFGDSIVYNPDSPSRPSDCIPSGALLDSRPSDDFFIDVEFYFVVS